jgi:HD-GYP domain-containing protein (c-di-GMP phosphodiesterase class II)
MLSDRPYRKALSLATVRDELNRFEGIQFDPELVAVVVRSNLLEEHHSQMRLSETLSETAHEGSVFALVEPASD